MAVRKLPFYFMIGLCFCAVMSMPLLLAVPALWPASYWFEVRSVTVLPGQKAGDVLLMKVDREIKRDFKGRWVVEVLKVWPNGNMTLRTECTGAGVNNYQTDDDLPETGPEPNELNLNWWSGVDCRLPDGRWVVDTVWTVEAPNFPQKVVRNRSNVFQVE